MMVVVDDDQGLGEEKRRRLSAVMDGLINLAFGPIRNHAFPFLLDRAQLGR